MTKCFQLHNVTDCCIRLFLCFQGVFILISPLYTADMDRRPQTPLKCVRNTHHLQLQRPAKSSSFQSSAIYKTPCKI